MSTTTTNYNLSIPTETYRTLKRIAAQESTSVAELLRKATRIYIWIRSIKQEPGDRLMVEREGELQEIVLDLI